MGGRIKSSIGYIFGFSRRTSSSLLSPSSLQRSTMFANKLKKQPPMSATLTLVSSGLTGTIINSPKDIAGHHPSTNSGYGNVALDRVSKVPIQPLTATEQYWATRALKAEALLAAHEDHKKELRTLGHVQDMKRERELLALAKEHKDKHDSLDRLVKFLAVVIVSLIVVIVYLATHYTYHSMLLHHKQQEKWWSMIGASHFTIPILSPFTSVVEHESSVISAKLIGTLAAILACLLYLGFRHWLGNHVKSGSGSLKTRLAAASIDR